jgi:hypothetical protein
MTTAIIKIGDIVKIHHPIWEGYIGEVKTTCPSSGTIIDHVWYSPPEWEVWVPEVRFSLWLWEDQLELMEMSI